MSKKKKDYIEDDFTFQLISSQEFKDYFIDEFCSAPKQKKKRTQLLQKILDKLSRYDEPFAMQLMETAVLNDYQGIFFQNTDVKYSQYLKAKQFNNNQAGVIQGNSGKQRFLQQTSEHLTNSIPREEDKGLQW